MFTRRGTRSKYGHRLLEQAVYGLPGFIATRSRRRHWSPIRVFPHKRHPGAVPARRERSADRQDADHRLQTGISGAGRGLKISSLFVEANENMSPYSIGHKHRHTTEMEQELNQTGTGPYRVIFSPHLLPVNQGILSTMYVTIRDGYDVAQVLDLYRQRYAAEPFVQILPEDQLATLRHVVNTNRCTISVTQVDGSNRFIVVSAIDNLIKGACGQAVQNMNIMFGLDERAGLGL